MNVIYNHSNGSITATEETKCRYANSSLHELTEAEETLRQSSDLPLAWIPDDIDNPAGSGSLQVFEPPLEDAKADKFAELAALRYEAEMSGFVEPTYNIFIPTDERTRSILITMVVRLSADPSYTIPNWKLSDGKFITLNGEKIIKLSNAVEGHVQAMFTKEKELCDIVEAATTVAEVRAVVWEA